MIHLNLLRKQFILKQIIRDMSNPTKLAKLTPYIGTHDLTFHCDDVTACAMLKSLDRFKDHDIVRTRDPELLAKADIVVDVGDVFDVDKLRLDHHQRSFQHNIKDFHPNLKTTNPNKPPRLSASGLVFTFFGKDYISKILNLGSKYEELDDKNKNMVDIIHEKSYTSFFEEIDAVDNGVEMVSGDNIIHNYHVNSDISSRVHRFNPSEKDPTPEYRLEQFKKAMEMVSAEMSQVIKSLGELWWPKRQKFRDLFLKRKEFDPSGQLVFIEGDGVVWKSIIYELEEEAGCPGEVKFVVYENKSDTSSWRLTAVPASYRSFASRVPLKEEWRGKRDEDLQRISGVPDATFVHNTGFTGGAKSLEGVKSMAYKTLGLN